MAYVNFKELKEERPARNFDKVDITEDFDIGAQDGDSLYGTFSFFHGIKSFFKKVMSAASALVSGKILMSDENGNVTGIAPSDLKTGMDLMNSEDVNNALANLTELKIDNTKTDCNDCIPSDWNKVAFFVMVGGEHRPSTVANYHVSNIRCERMAISGAFSGYEQTLTTNENRTYKRYFNGSTWSEWQELATKSDLEWKLYGELFRANELKDIPSNWSELIVYVGIGAGDTSFLTKHHIINTPAIFASPNTFWEGSANNVASRIVLDINANKLKVVEAYLNGTNLLNDTVSVLYYR